MTKKEIITTTREQQQRYSMNQAKIAVGSKGRQWEARADIISLLRSIKADVFEKQLADKFNIQALAEFKLNAMDVLKEFNNQVSELVAYYSDIKKKVIDEEDVSSERFLKYREVLSKCYRYLFFIDEVIVFMQKDTDLEELTIPSHYFVYVSKDEIEMPKDVEEYGGFYEEHEDVPDEDDS